MNTLTTEERDFLEKLEQKRLQHLEAQKKYREKNKDIITQYNKEYYNKIKEEKQKIKEKLLKDITPIKIDVLEITKPEKVDKRTREGKKKVETINIKPAFETRKTPLKLNTIKRYIQQINIINKKINNKDLSSEVKAELTKLLNDNSNVNEKLILDEMTYINDDIDKSIDFLRKEYPNDNSFKTYIVVLSVFTSHLKTINNEIYQKLTKTGIYTNDIIQSKRKDNLLDDEDEGKIIDLNKKDILYNLNKLDDAEDRLIYGLYTLFPARRLEYRLFKLTAQTNLENLNYNNYLVISTNPKLFIFNDYKTAKTYGKQIFEVPEELDALINNYIKIKNLKGGENLFSLERSKKEIYDESNFSKKVSLVFNKVYGIPLSIRFLRMSWSIHINEQKISVNKREELINMMAHSTSESQKYYKLVEEKK